MAEENVSTPRETGPSATQSAKKTHMDLPRFEPGLPR